MADDKTETALDVVGVGNAIVDVLAEVDEASSTSTASPGVP